MKNTNIRTPIQAKSMRRVALGLLAAVAVLTGTVAAPLAGTANAGGARGGIIEHR